MQAIILFIINTPQLLLTNTSLKNKHFLQKD